ncbi:acyl-CoA dehydrogenase [Paracoccidioides lutzii Pb01]|uniref:Acyl-CoA dehydrogenase n=1 Tax=Paracoccidioides lutzii (strain ATCC MYA-826 / Pb01) TaxID=502779 RepID=C1GYB3_PARBA|nr:acyl-CoA dehydrogenase [Paracoccidioides lutzii Pb01]EEH41504.1 acyl-CoA dehydrogenase [Paracoccidioides lutzii Pb01]
MPQSQGSMNFDLPSDLVSHISSLDKFIQNTILPLQHAGDNNRFFDYRREHARTDWDNGGLPRREWEDMLVQARKLADQAGFYRFPLPKIYGGAANPNTNLWMSAIRYHLTSHPVYGGGVSLANDLQTEHSVVGNFPDILMLHHFGNKEQRHTLIPARLRGEYRATFGLTEPKHGSDATFMETIALPDRREYPASSGPANAVDGFVINGAKKWQTGAHHCTHMIVFARTSGKPGSSRGITAFLVPRKTPGINVISYEWTFNMPTDHATVGLDDVFVPRSAILGELDMGLAIAQTFVHENRIRQAASSCGAARFCLDKSIEYAKEREVWGKGKTLADNQAIQFQVVELMTQVEMLRLLILRTSCEMDKITAECGGHGDAPVTGSKKPWVEIEKRLSDQVAMCNFWANRLCCQAADRAIQIHGGNGYSRHKPFEHIYRHFRRYRITEGSEEIQMRKIAAYIFGFAGPRKIEEAKKRETKAKEEEEAKKAKL